MDKQILNFLDRYYTCIDQFSIRKKDQLELYIHPKPILQFAMIDIMVERIVKIIIQHISMDDEALITVQYGETKRCIKIEEKSVYSDSHMILLNKQILSTIEENLTED